MRTKFIGMFLLAALLLGGVAGTVLAKEVICKPKAKMCLGTNQDDEIAGSARADRINGKGGNDIIVGDNSAVAGGNDRINAGGGDDLVFDIPVSEEFVNIIDKDVITAGNGNDIVVVLELTGGADTVDCGPGTDAVFFDEGIDTVNNCELLNPPLVLDSLIANPAPARAALGL
jgi:hypothetical protein